MNYGRVKHELLRALRGDRTQLELSRRLGYSFNQVGKWESDAKRLKWPDFYDLCEVVGAPIDRALREVFLVIQEDPREPLSVIQALRCFHGSMPLPTISKKLHCHISVLRRWIAGTVVPDVEAIFGLMDLRKGFFPLFLSKLAPVDSLPSVQDRILADELTRSRIKTDPELVSVELALRLEAYKALPTHSDSFIAQATSLRIADVQERLRWLESSGRIRLTNGKYATVRNLDNLTGDPVAVARLRRHWAQRTLDRFDTPNGVPTNSKLRPNFQSCLVCTVSKQEMSRIFDILNRCFEEIRQLESPTPQAEDEIRVLMMDFFSPDDAPVRAFPLHADQPSSSRYPRRLSVRAPQS